MEIAASIVGTIAERCVDPILRQFGYLIFYKSNVQTLNDDIIKLKLKETEVEEKVRRAEDNAEDIKPTVVDWQKQVEDAMKDAHTIYEGMKTVKVNCFRTVRLPNLKACYLLGRRAAKRTSVVEKLLGEGQFNEVGDIPPLGNMPFSESDPSLEEGLVTRMSKKKEVIKALEQGKTSLVAICGMPGVGKSYLVDQIADQVKFEQLFKVAKETVSQTPNMRIVQDKIAEQLGLKISEQTDHLRAERMCERLTNSRKGTLVILDDIWKQVDFKSLGIPVKDECKSSKVKVILTSRFSGVCRDMGAEIIEIDELHAEEARHLFKKEVGISDDSILNDIANQVAGECKGLPLAIVVVAKAFRKIDRTVESWEQNLEQLKKYTIRDLGVEDEAFSRIEFSYANLESKEDQSLLLLCSLFPEDYSISIECLARYVKGLELFEDRQSLVDVRFRVDKLIDRLKSSYLLQSDGEKEDSIKLHDVVRDACLKIASKDEHEFLVKNAGVGVKNSYTAISLTLEDSIPIHDLLLFCKKCTRLRLLRLELRRRKFNLSEDSFIGMEHLEVMELNNSSIEFSLSWPGQMLWSLRTLCLDYCILGTGMSSMLGQIMQLETLSLFQSKIEDDQFPTEIACLSNLKLLDLRVKSSLHPLTSGILSSLEKLEELYLGSHLHLPLGRDKEEERGRLKEISSISHLACLQIDLYDLNLLLSFLQEFDTQRLKRFHLVVANYGREKRDLSKNYQFRRRFELSLSDKEALDDLPSDEALKQVLDPKVTSIVKRTEDLTLNLSKSSRLSNLVPDLGENGFINLKKLVLITGQYDCLIDSTTKFVDRHVFDNLVSMRLKDLKLKEICKGVLPSQCFSQLQEVELHGITTLEYLWNGPVEPPSFCNLRSIKVYSCHQITTLFSQSTLKCLVKLQHINVCGCENLESIVLREGSLKEDVLELPGLKALNIWQTNLMGFGSKDDKGGAFFDQVSLPRLEKLDIKLSSGGPDQLIGGKMRSGSLDSLKSVELFNCHTIQCIAKADTVTLLQNLQALVVVSCREIEFLIDFEGPKVPNTSSKKGLEILPKLKSLDLSRCPRLTHMWRHFSEGVRVFQNLRSIRVSKCPLSCLFYPPCVTNMLVSLEKLAVGECLKMRAVIGEEDEEVSQEDNAQQHDDAGKHREIAPERTSKEFVFPKLSYLRLEDLENLQSFGGSHREDCEFKFPLLTQLIIMSCPKLKKFCSGDLVAPLLEKIKTSKKEENVEAPMDLKDREICPLTESELRQRW